MDPKCRKSNKLDSPDYHILDWLNSDLSDYCIKKVETLDSFKNITTVILPNTHAYRVYVIHSICKNEKSENDLKSTNKNEKSEIDLKFICGLVLKDRYNFKTSKEIIYGYLIMCKQNSQIRDFLYDEEKDNSSFEICDNFNTDKEKIDKYCVNMYNFLKKFIKPLFDGSGLESITKGKPITPVNLDKNPFNNRKAELFNKLIEKYNYEILVYKAKIERNEKIIIQNFLLNFYDTIIKHIK